MDSKEKEDIDYFQKMIDSEKFIILGRMSSSIAHEINNPVMIIQNLTSLLLDDIDEEGKLDCKPNSENYESLQEIINECKRISNITRSLQDFSRTSSIKPQTQKIEAIILNVVNFMRHLFVKNQVQVKINAEAAHTDCLIKIDQIQQVFVNILDNSLYSLNKKYGSKKTARDKKYIEINFKNDFIGKGKDKKEYIIVEIYDDGIGIPEKDKKNIFQPFFTTKKTKEGFSDELEKNKGLGLGLSFSQIILKDHDGFIKFDSKVNEYAKFSVYFPVSSYISEDKDETEEIVF